MCLSSELSYLGWASGDSYGGCGETGWASRAIVRAILHGLAADSGPLNARVIIAAGRNLSSTPAPSFAVTYSIILKSRKIADGSDAGRKRFASAREVRAGGC